MERLPPPPAALLPPIIAEQQRVSTYERTSDLQQQKLASSYDGTSPLSDQQRASLIRSLSDRLTDFQREEEGVKQQGRTVPSPPLRLHHSHHYLRKQFEGGGQHQLQQKQGGGQAYPQQPFPKPLHGPI